MRKVKLDVERLAEGSFETAAAHGRGGVVGRMPTLDIRPVGAPGDFYAAGTHPEYPCPACQDTSCDGSCQPGCVPDGIGITG